MKNEKFTIERSELNKGNFDNVTQSELLTDTAAPEPPPEVTIAIILAGLIQEGVVV